MTDSRIVLAVDTQSRADDEDIDLPNNCCLYGLIYQLVSLPDRYHRIKMANSVTYDRYVSNRINEDAVNLVKDYSMQKVMTSLRNTLTPSLPSENVSI